MILPERACIFDFAAPTRRARRSLKLLPARGKLSTIQGQRHGGLGRGRRLFSAAAMSSLTRGDFRPPNYAKTRSDRALARISRCAIYRRVQGHHARPA
jgi:hypothetical protein